MNLGVIGSRSFNNYDLVKETLDEYKNLKKVVSGGAKGADTLGVDYAKDHNLEWIEYLPEWDINGRSSAFKRNITIVDNSDEILAFWDGKSKGTAHSISLAKKQGKRIRIILVDNKGKKIKDYIEK